MKPGDPELTRFLAHLSEVSRAGTVLCPVCRSRDWTVHDLVNVLSHMKDVGPMLDGPVFLVVSCKRCAYVMNFYWKRIAEREISDEQLETVRRQQGLNEHKSTTVSAPESKDPKP